MKVFTFTILCVSALFFYPLHMRSMQKEEQTETVDLFSLIELPAEILGHIAYQSCSDWIVPQKVLDVSIKFCIQLSTLCKKFHKLLTAEAIGNLFKYYDHIGNVRFGSGLFF